MNKFFIIITLLFLPLTVFAQESRSLQQIVTDLIVTGGNYILVLLVGLTLFVFLYGMMKFMYKGQESDAARSEGRKFMFWGIIGLFVMTSIWAIVGLLTSVIGQENVTLPQFNIPTEEEKAPFGRFADGTPITEAEYEAGQKARKVIENAIEELPSQTKQVLDKASELAGDAVKSTISGAQYLWRLITNSENK